MSLTTNKNEYELVLEWRTHQLERAGLPVLAASSLASTGVDIEYACYVVRKVLAAGEPYQLAVDIIL